jgi:hypothetical protein
MRVPRTSEANRQALLDARKRKQQNRAARPELTPAQLAEQVIAGEAMRRSPSPPKPAPQPTYRRVERLHSESVDYGDRWGF